MVFHVRLEILGEPFDPFRKDRNLHLRQPRTAGFRPLAFDDFGLAAGTYRHRLSCLRLCDREWPEPGCRPAGSRGGIMRGPSPAPAAQYSKMPLEASEIVPRTNLHFTEY